MLLLISCFFCVLEIFSSTQYCEWGLLSVIKFITVFFHPKTEFKKCFNVRRFAVPNSTQCCPRYPRLFSKFFQSNSPFFDCHVNKHFFFHCFRKLLLFKSHFTLHNFIVPLSFSRFFSLQVNITVCFS